MFADELSDAHEREDISLASCSVTMLPVGLGPFLKDDFPSRVLMGTQNSMRRSRCRSRLSLERTWFLRCMRPLNRAFDQIFAMPGFNTRVTFVLDRAGIGDDAASHNGMWI